MSVIKEGVHRPDLYPACKTCPVASKAIMDAQKESGYSTNIEVACIPRPILFGLLGHRIWMRSVATNNLEPAKNLRDVIPESATIDTYVTDLQEVTHLCPEKNR